jgi:hypothetical protein
VALPVQHGFHKINVIFGAPLSWAKLPSREEVERVISLAVLAQSEIADETLGFYKPPRRIGKLSITLAALDQIHCMWHGFRESPSISPPAIPLQYFIVGFGQKPPDTWVDIEVHPGLSTWDAYEDAT